MVKTMKPNEPVVTVQALRESLGLPPERPDGVRDVLAALSDAPAGSSSLMFRLALGDWPEAWRADPPTGPQFLVTLLGHSDPFQIRDIYAIDATRWGDDTGADPQERLVPVAQLDDAASLRLRGSRLRTGLSFGWPEPEERFAFL
jgi:hypothetical protein